MFDINWKIALKIQSPKGIKTINVRFPTDEEWTERQRSRKVIIKSLSRGVSETIVPDSEEVDAQLLAKIRTEGSSEPEVDAFEASQIIDQLSLAEVDDITLDEGVIRVSLRVFGSVTTHVLRIPSAKEIIQYRRAFSRILDLHYNKQQLLINLNAAAELYGKIKQETQGYVGDAVPIIHQTVVVKAAIDELESGLGVADSENF